jgi:hypothetical protein
LELRPSLQSNVMDDSNDEDQLETSKISGGSDTSRKCEPSVENVGRTHQIKC